MIKLTDENREDIQSGARVRLNPAYGHGTKYFVCYLGGPHCLIADCKRDCNEGLGYIYWTHDIEAYENL